MPSKNVKVTAWSWHWDGSQWVQDDLMTKDIAVAVFNTAGKPVSDRRFF